MPTLIVSERGKEKEDALHFDSDVISIGRHDDNFIHLPSHRISRYHAEIVKQKNDHFISDLGSGNGTFLNGQRLEANEQFLLKRGDVITIDTFDLRYLEDDKTEPGLQEDEVTESDVLEVKLLKKVLAALDKETAPSLEVLNGVEEGKKMYLTDDITSFIVGRDSEAAFPINEHVISRHHAKISKKWGGISIRDLESKNGTFVNNRRVVEEFLHDGDRIAFGTILVMFRNPQEINVESFERMASKRKPAAINPNEIPLTEKTAAPETSSAEEHEMAEDKSKEDVSEQSEQSVSEEMKKKKSFFKRKMKTALNYPTPHTAQKLTTTEISLIGIGSLILLLALITIINLLFS
ncbi:MAG: hypothetical protein COX62_03875 [Deltaproteobacteria bacterium CG_4_10_14_0_2_um_filter_43_8]|nr:MAG: hypothetical protein COV43_00985 [Deltaproteobacteria bacterium CG11_big_fil_rev_8_21_14_0_20_42_23]PJA20851.1 MAG: hypothetical protein COX62_03875 [Deltaproteobacteria bacterium CG_4_10_14_0_2_um_filter_43_8]PJC63570.1 MAG: hypothetical protein CO021_09005 [Deltaproteobacteria bacterium CG_4_9_14_0_2_um_filter_42_21]